MALQFRASFDDSDVTRAYRNMTTGAETVVGKVSASFAVLTSTALFAGLVSGGAKVMAFAENIADSAEAAQLSMQAYQELTGVFEQGGVSAEKFAKGMGILTQSIQEALDGNLKTITSFERLGVTWQELNTLSVEEVLMQIADGLKNAKDGTEAYAAAADVLGKGQQKLIGQLTQGSEALANQRKEIQTMSDAGIKALDELGDAWTRLGRTILSSVGNAVGYASNSFEALFDDIYGNDRAKDFFNSINNQIANPPGTGAPKVIPEDPRVTKAREEADKMATESLKEYYKLEHQARTEQDKLAAQSLQEYYRMEHEAMMKEQNQRINTLRSAASNAESALSQSMQAQLNFGLMGPDARRQSRRDQQDVDREQRRINRMRERGTRDARPGGQALADTVAIDAKTLTELSRLLALEMARQIPK